MLTMLVPLRVPLLLVQLPATLIVLDPAARVLPSVAFVTFKVVVLPPMVVLPLMVNP